MTGCFRWGGWCSAGDPPARVPPLAAQVAMRLAAAGLDRDPAVLAWARHNRLAALLSPPPRRAAARGVGARSPAAAVQAARI